MNYWFLKFTFGDLDIQDEQLLKEKNLQLLKELWHKLAKKMQKWVKTYNFPDDQQLVHFKTCCNFLCRFFSFFAGWGVACATVGKNTFCMIIRNKFL